MRNDRRQGWFGAEKSVWGWLQSRRRLAPRSVEVGQRYYKVGPLAPVWVVRRVFVPEGMSSLHVMLEREGGHREVSLIAAERLFDTEVFRQDRRTHRVTPPPPTHRRRRDDPRTGMRR